jgi:integrase
VARTVAAEQARLLAEDAAAAREIALAKAGSLERLLMLYLEHLAGKPSVKDARNIFENHVPSELKQRRAAALGMGDFLEPISACVTAGKGRTAGKLRSYLRAAYELALSSQSDPGAPEALRALGIDHNPVASVSTRTLRQFNRTRERALDADEPGALMVRVEAMRAGAVRDLLLLTLYLGGQRHEQLLRLEHSDVDLPGRTLTLYDGKGRRILPRVHVLPLVPQAVALLEPHVKVARHAGIPNVWGRMHPATLSHAVQKVCEAMLATRDTHEPFQLRDFRRTCETQLAALRVSKDVRGHIQSHGLGGVQDRHYDRHDYLPEKRSALLRLAKHLEKLKAAHVAR